MAYLLVGKRAKEIAAAAAKFHLEYLERDPSGISRHALSLFAQSDGHVAENLLVGTMRGHEVYGFDYPYLTAASTLRDQLPPGFPTMRYENGNQYGCVIVPFEADFPMVYLTKRGRRSHLSGMETPVKVANKAFAKMFQVWADDPVFLHRLLTDDVVELLVGTKGRFTFELYRNMLLCLDYAVQPDEFPPLMSLAVAFVERIPGALGDEYPPVDHALWEPVVEEAAPTGFAALSLTAPGEAGDAEPSAAAGPGPTSADEAAPDGDDERAARPLPPKRVAMMRTTMDMSVEALRIDDASPPPTPDPVSDPVSDEGGDSTWF